MSLHRDQRWISRALRFSCRFLTLAILVTSGAFGGHAQADAADPLILFNHEQSGTLIYSYFDTADPGMPNPVDIAQLPFVKDCKTLGVFNGILYIAGSDGNLTGVDLGSGERLLLNTSLPERHVKEGPMIYIPPGQESPEVIRMIDLRGPFAREVLFPSEMMKRYKAYQATDDRLRYFHFDDLEERPIPAAADEVDTLRCTIGDLRTPESPPLRFSATVQAAGQTWYIEPRHWVFPGRADPYVVLVRHPPKFEVMPFTWISHDTFACVAPAVEVEGIAWEGKGDGGPSLFVLNVQTRTGRILPLSSLPIRPPLDPKKGGFDPNYYTIDTRSMTILDQKGSRVEVLSEHFSTSRNGGPMQMLHGAQPLEMNRERNVSHVEVDASGERVLLRFPRVSVCYDIYNGYYAECDSLNCLRFIERSELHRVEVASPAGWTSLLQQPARGLPETALVPARRDRASAYQLTAVPSQSAYPEGDVISIQLTLTHLGPTSDWTEAPTPDFPVLSGTLANSAYAVLLSNVEGLKRQSSALPVYLNPGDMLTSTLEFTLDTPGDYTLALAYGGNRDSEWFGRAKAPLVRFSVGDATQDGNARLRYAIQDFIKRRGNMGDKFFEELRASGDQGADLLAAMLLEMPMPIPTTQQPDSDDSHAHWSTVMSLYGYLRDLRSPRQIPFFQELLASDIQDVKSHGLSGIEALHKRSKDPEFKTRMEGIIREAYADDEPVWRARAERELGVELWPDVYEQLKMRVASEDVAESKAALQSLAEQYLWRRDTFSGDLESYTHFILANEELHMSMFAVQCIDRFYKRQVDVPAAQRGIDYFRYRFSRVFDQHALKKHGDLWDMAWLRRAALEPTEARFELLQRSVVPLETHCGVARSEAYPKSWRELESSDAARSAFAEALNAWADCIESNPAPFRVPDLKK